MASHCKAFLVGAVALLLIVAPAASTRLVVFGDSLSQAGDDINKLTATQFVLAQAPFYPLSVFPPPPYDNGRSCDGPVYTELLASELGLDLYDYAVLGAATGASGTPTIALPVNATFILSIDVPTLPYEVAAFLKSYTPAASDINLINIGAGDLLQAIYGPFGTPILPSQYGSFVSGIVKAYVTALDTLYAAGGRKFLLTGVPDPTKLPIIMSGSNALTNTGILTTLVTLINKQAAVEAALYHLSHPGAVVTYYDGAVWSDSAGIIAAGLGIDTKSFCVQKPLYLGSTLTPEPSAALDGSVCTDPSKLGFWDPADASAAVQKILKDLILPTVKAMI